MRKLLLQFFAVRGPLHGAINAVVLAVIILSAAWTVYVWTRPLSDAAESEAPVRTQAKAPEEAPSAKSDYSILDEKDPFGPVRVKVAAIKSKPPAPPPVLLAPPPPPPPPPKPVPKFVVVGTVILGANSTALITYPGGARESYKTGEIVEGFLIKQIRSDSVYLERDGQVIRVFITEPHGGANRSAP